MKKIIVTGASGFIGRNLIKELSEKEYSVVAVVRNVSSNVKELEGLRGVNIICCNMEEIQSLGDRISDRDIDTCIHLAWEGSFGDARADYALQLRNVKYALDVVNAVAAMGVNRFVGVGTLAEKDVLNYHPTDGATPNAVSMYGIAKVAAHFMTKTQCNKRNIEHIWCYLSNTYGVGNTTNNFINMASGKMIRGEHAAFTEGTQLYDFMYITDTVRALRYAAEKGKKNVAYYLGSTRPLQLREYIKMIRDAIDPQIELFFGEIPFNGNPLSASEYDTDKLVNDTGFFPEVPFEKGIVKTVEWLKTEQEGTV